MQVIHGKKGTLKKRKFKQPNLGSFLIGYKSAKKVLKNKEVVRNATNSGSTSAAASTLEPNYGTLEPLQKEGMTDHFWTFGSKK